MELTGKSRFGVLDIDIARKRLFMRFVTTGTPVKQAAEKSGMSRTEAKAFLKSEEYIRMARRYWTKFLHGQLKKGSQKLFLATVRALQELTSLLQDKNPEVRLRAVSELRQWLSDPKNSVLKRLSDQILEEGDSAEDTEEDYTEEEARTAKAFLSAARKAAKERRNGNHFQ